MSNNINIKNKKAKFEYEFLEKFTAGLQLYGTEIKSIRAGKASIVEGYCFVKDGEVFIKNMYIAEYEQGSYNNHEPRRDRKLLLNRNEIDFEAFSIGDTISKRLSKSMAIPNGKILNIEEQQELLAALFACKENQVSPFNLPILINFDSSDLDKQIT